MRDQHRPTVLGPTRRPPPTCRPRCGSAALLDEPGPIAFGPFREESAPRRNGVPDG